MGPTCNSFCTSFKTNRDAKKGLTLAREARSIQCILFAITKLGRSSRLKEFPLPARLCSALVLLENSKSQLPHGTKRNYLDRLQGNNSENT